MTISTAAELATLSTAGRPRGEALESWAEGRRQPGARVGVVDAAGRADHGASEVAGGRAYAGTHLLVDLWGAERLDDLALCEATLREAVDAVGATLLHLHLHHFTPNHGISGVAVLAESHISIHTWPELGFAALDVFVCGSGEAEAAVPVFRRAWSPREVRLSGHRRGERE